MAVFTEQFQLGGDGLNVAIKDSIDVVGFTTRCGSRALADSDPVLINAEVVDQVLLHGCRLVGKTAMHEFAYGMTGINDFAGTPVNHRYPNLISGGSSSGSAVAVAVALADFSIGTDTGGSIRLPAACCGVYGLKPTYGRISREGVLPAESSLDCVGPMADSIEMLIRAMQLIDPSFSQLPEIQEPTIGLVDLAVDPLISSVVEQAVLRSGFNTQVVKLDRIEQAFDAGMSIINAETWSAFGGYLKTGLLGEDVALRLAKAADTSSELLCQAEQVREEFTAEVDALLKQVTVLALPTLPIFPPTLEEARAGKMDLKISSLVRPFNLSGHPALSIPFVTGDNRPVGLQLIGNKGADEQLCVVARMLVAASQEPKNSIGVLNNVF